MNRKTNVKVQRTALIGALESKIKSHRADHAKAKANIDTTTARAAKAISKKLRHVADGLDRGIWPSSSYVRIDRPVAGRSDNQLPDMERAVKMLKLSAEETITITAEDYGKYL